MNTDMTNILQENINLLTLSTFRYFCTGIAKGTSTGLINTLNVITGSLSHEIIDLPIYRFFSFFSWMADGNMSNGVLHHAEHESEHL